MLVALAALALFELFAIRSSATQARSSLAEAVTALARGETKVGVEFLASARSAVDEATSRSQRPHLRLAQVIPYFGTDIKVVRSSVAAASEVTAAIELIAEHLDSPHDPVYDAGQVDSEAAQALAIKWQGAAALMQTASDRMDSIPQAHFESVTSAAAEVTQRAGQGAIVFEAMAVALDKVFVGAVGDDPLHVLFVFTNGAELRALGGVPVFLARIDVTNGRVRLGEVIPTPAAHPSQPVESPVDFDALFGGFAASRLWSNLTMSPDGPTVGEVGARMYAARTGITPDVVIVTDLVATGNLLAAFPNLEVDGAPFEPTTLATDFLYATYRDYPDGTEQNAYLVGVFADVFGQVISAQPDGTALVTAVGKGIEEGRWMAWSPDSALQEAFVVTGAGHHLPTDAPGRVDVTVQNFAATKLDLFTDVTTDLELETLGCALVGHLEITITESAPAQQRAVLAYGAPANRWWVNVYFSPDASVKHLLVGEEPTTGGLGSWEGRPVASILVNAPLGGSNTVGVEWVEPLPRDGTVTVSTNATVDQPRRETLTTVPASGNCPGLQR